MNRADYTLSSPATSLGAIAMLAAGIVIALLVHWLFFWFAQRVVRRTRREADDAILAALYQPARWLIALIGFGAALAPIRLGPTLSGYWTIGGRIRSEEHTSELQSLMRLSYAVFCLKKKKKSNK